MRLADVMSHPPNVVADTTPGVHCAAIMARLGVRHLPVVDGSGRCTGVVTDHELRRHRLWIEESFDHTTARVLQRQVDVVLSPAVGVGDALRRLDRTTQDLVVVARDDGVPVGIFTEHDAVGVAAKALPDQPLPLTQDPLPLLDANLPAHEARSWLARERLLHALLVREERLVGVLSLRDVAVEDDLADHLTAADVASRPIATRRRLSARTTAAVLYRRGIGCLPLVDDEARPLDITTRRELLRALAESVER